MRLVPSYHINALLKALHLFSDIWLYDHVVTSYLTSCIAICFMNWYQYGITKFVFTKIYFHRKSDFLQKFFATKIWSHTVSMHTGHNTHNKTTTVTKGTLVFNSKWAVKWTHCCSWFKHWQTLQHIVLHSCGHTLFCVWTNYLQQCLAWKQV